MRVSASLGQAVMQVRISDRRHWRTLSRRRVSADDRLSSGTAIETGLVPLAQEGRLRPFEPLGGDQSQKSGSRHNVE
jgi:hypothetical protein